MGLFLLNCLGYIQVVSWLSLHTQFVCCLVTLILYFMFFFSVNDQKKSYSWLIMEILYDYLFKTNFYNHSLTKACKIKVRIFNCVYFLQNCSNNVEAKLGYKVVGRRRFLINPEFLTTLRNIYRMMRNYIMRFN